jgi:CHAT domain-containing protein
MILSGCLTLVAPKEDVLARNAKYGEIVTYLEPRINNGEKPKLRSAYYLCWAYQELKKYDKIFPCLDQLIIKLEASERTDQTIGLPGSAYYLRAKTNLELGNYAKAIEEAKISIKKLKADSTLLVSFEGSTISPLMVMGLSHALMGEKDEALTTVKAMNNTTAFLATSRERSRGVAAIYMALGKYQEAVDIMSGKHIGYQLTKGATWLYDPLNMSWLFLELPYDFMKNKALLETHKYSEAKAGYDKLLKQPRIKDTSGIYWQLLADRGRIALHEKQNDQAIEFLKKSIDVIEQQRSSINTDVSKIGFVGDKQEVYKNLISTLVQQEKFSDAFAYAERAKARALVDMLASKKQFSGGEQGGLKTSSLLSDLDRSEADSFLQDERLTSQDILKTRGIITTKKQEILQAAPELASLVTVNAPNVRELQKLLPKDEMLVEYYGVGDDLYVFLLNKVGVSAGKLNGKGLAESVLQYRKALIESNSDKHKTLGSDLYKRLVYPLTRAIKTKNITIVPHGILHYLPFNALYTGKEYVVDKYNIRLLPSASVMKFLKNNRKGQKGSLLALGNPDLGNPQYDLPGAQVEAIAIARKIKGAKVLVRGNATESAVKKNGNQFRYLHLASHGTFDTEKPLSSALLLAKDAANDGKLTVGELYDLKLNADLVTLSACETALGKIANGDDVVGFTRGFLYAGASSIVSSLWKVDDDATSLLMQEFYSKLQSTNKRDALRAAQLKLKAGKYSHPNYWAAFQLTGSVN